MNEKITHCQCCTCGHRWQKGQDGSHSCSEILGKHMGVLRECNAQLVVSEQSIRNECNRLRAENVTLKNIAKALADLDWCIGYELTSSQHDELDSARGAAIDFLKSIA